MGLGGAGGDERVERGRKEEEGEEIRWQSLPKIMVRGEERNKGLKGTWQKRQILWTKGGPFFLYFFSRVWLTTLLSERDVVAS